MHSEVEAEREDFELVYLITGLEVAGAIKLCSALRVDGDSSRFGCCRTVVYDWNASVTLPLQTLPLERMTGVVVSLFQGEGPEAVFQLP